MICNAKTIALGVALLPVVALSAPLRQSVPGQAAHDQAVPGQSRPASPSSAAGLEFPVLMRQNVVAGKTAAGTKIQATLAVATLVRGVVVPQGAIFTGEVTESVAKSATDPSQLALRMDSAEWKDKTQSRSAPVVLALAPKVYLTAWYYPVILRAHQDMSSGLPDLISTPGVGNTGSVRSSPRNPPSPSPQFPPTDENSDKDKVPTPTSDISKYRIQMKDVESTHSSEGAITLISKHSNIKLDRTTTYVLAAGDLLPVSH